MGQRPFFFEQICVDRQRREGIIPHETKVGVHRSEHSEHARFLHPVQFAPEIVLYEHVGQMKLRFELFRWRKQRQLNVVSAERVHRQRIQRELNATAFNQLLAKFSLRRVFTLSILSN